MSSRRLTSLEPVPRRPTTFHTSTSLAIDPSLVAIARNAPFACPAKSSLTITGRARDMAVRAYHRGIKRAVAGMGVPYARMVEHRLRQYIRNGGRSRTWDYLWRRDREIRAEQWPWLALARRSIPIHISGESDIALTVAMSVAR